MIRLVPKDTTAELLDVVEILALSVSTQPSSHQARKSINYGMRLYMHDMRLSS